MRTNNLFTVAIALFLCIYSCKQEQQIDKHPSSEDGTEKTEGFNNCIQGKFFDTSFGASKDTIITNFKKHNLKLDTYTSNEQNLSFDAVGSRSYSFGNMSWEQLNVHLYNGVFYMIRFYNAHKNLKGAIDSYENIMSHVKRKYKMEDYDSNDSTLYRFSYGYDNHHKEIHVSCYRYESVSHDIWYASELSYIDFNYTRQVNKEL